MESGLNNSILDKSNIVSNGQCVFVQRWREIFNSKTFETYKCRLTNSHGILEEYLDILKKVNSGMINESNIEPVKIECIKKITDDSVFKSNNVELHNLLKSRIGTPKGTRINLISEMEVAKKQLDNQYLTWILKDLKSSIDEENLSDVQKHTENLATELVYKGWNKGSLYRLLKIIFIESDEEFDTKWLKFTSSVTGPKETFKCYIKINKGVDEYTNRVALKGKEIIKKLNLSFNKIIEDKAIYLEFKGEAYGEDLNSFTEKVSQELIDIESEYIYFGQIINFDKTKAIVVLPTKNITSYNISAYNAKEYYKNNSASDKPVHTISEYKEMQEKISDEEIKLRLKNILVQYKLGYNSDSVETWFSSFWFALESLVATNQYDYIIEQIINIVTPIVTVRYPKQIIENFIKDFERCGVNLSKFGIEGHDNENIIKMVEILKDKEKIKELNAETSDYSLLSIRIKSISKWVENSLTLKKFLENHYTNIEWHLRRLFRIRNSFVHSANVDYDLYPVTMHLHSYLRDVLSEIFTALKNECTHDVNQIYSCSSMKYTMVMEKLKTSGKGDYKSDLICFDNCCTMI